MNSSKIAFVDFEALSLSPDSYPIEVGWTFADGSGGSMLIKPEPTWVDWSSEAESVHGISRAVLAEEGVPAAEAARLIVQIFGESELYSDAPEADQKWLNILLASADLTPAGIQEVYGAYNGAVRQLIVRMPASIASSLAQSFLMQAETEAEREVPTQHRALHDARRLWWVWRRLGELARTAVDAG